MKTVRHWNSVSMMERLWNNSVVTTADVLAFYESSKQWRGYFNFLQSLWRKKTKHNGSSVTPDFILGEIARFKNKQKWSEIGIDIGNVLENYRLKFLQDFCFSGAEVGQKKLTAQFVVSAFRNYKKLDTYRARIFSSFLLHCFERDIDINSGWWTNYCRKGCRILS